VFIMTLAGVVLKILAWTTFYKLQEHTSPVIHYCPYIRKVIVFYKHSLQLVLLLLLKCLITLNNCEESKGDEGS